MYGNPAFAPAYGAAAPFAGNRAMARHSHPGMVAFGAAEPTFMDKTKVFLDEKNLGVANKFWLGGALVGATLLYGHSAGWFGR